MTHRRSLDARRGISKPIFKQAALLPWIWLHETALGKGRGVPWIFCLQRAKHCVERMCKLVPGHYAHGHSDWILSSALGASHCLYPWHMVRRSQVSWRVWSQDLNLSNQCVPSSLATVMGSGLGQWPIGAQGPDSCWNQGEEELSCCWKGWGQWGQSTAVGEHKVSLGQLVTFLLPSGQRCWLENEGAAEPRTWELQLLLWSCSSPWDLREAICLWILLLLCELVGTMLGFLSSRLRGDPGNASVWVLAGFREDMPDGTGRLQSTLDSGDISWKWSEKSFNRARPLQPQKLHDLWNSAGKNTGMGSLSLLQGIFQTQGLNPGFRHCRQILSRLSHKGGPRILDWVDWPFCSRSGFLTQESNWAFLQCRRILHQLRYQGSPISLKTSF